MAAPLKVYLDTDGLLDLITTADQAAAEDVASALSDGDLKFVTSELLIAEALVHAVRNNDLNRERELRVFVTPSNWLTVEPVSRPILEAALHLRALHNFRTPDSIHIATGLGRGCSRFLTKDEKWQRAGFDTLSVLELAEAVRDRQSGGD